MTQNYSIFQPADVFFRARKIDFSTLLPLSQPPTHQFCYSGKISPAPPARPSQININPINNLKHWIIHVQLMWPKGHLRPSPRLGHHQTSSSSSTILVLLENARKAGKSARFAGLCNKPRNSEQKKNPSRNAQNHHRHHHHAWGLGNGKQDQLFHELTLGSRNRAGLRKYL